MTKPAANVYSHMVIAIDIARHVTSIIKSTIRMCFFRAKKTPARFTGQGTGVTNLGGEAGGELLVDAP